MRKKPIILMAVVLLVSSIFSSIACAANTLSSDRKIAPIISTDWLESNGSLDDLVIIDIRNADDYAKGHIANSINITADAESAWSVTRNGLIMEMPDEAALFNVIGNCGIKNDSLVVIVTAVAEAPNPPYPLANATRTADTLIYAGVKNVTILDGGYTKWVADGKQTTAEVPKVKKTTYKGTIDKDMIVTVDYVQKSIGKSVIIDARDADVYSGVTIE
ncbi:MAG: rhodanese-like domain-containing protein, partial [Spirochaetales bacterium]|nr:rhodanese-like domain-containing protein [Spirochaetales bacterium]